MLRCDSVAPWDRQQLRGFVDHDEDGCPLSIESWNEYSEWRSLLRYPLVDWMT